MNDPHHTYFKQPEADPWIVGSSGLKGTDNMGAAACAVPRAGWAAGRAAG